VQAGAGNSSEGMEAGGRLGNAWHAHGRAAGEVAPAGGGAAAAAERRPGVKHYRRQEGKQSRGARARGRRREGRGPGDLFGNSKNFRDPTVKKDFPLM
jgi:hypothetical protein